MDKGTVENGGRKRHILRKTRRANYPSVQVALSVVTKSRSNDGDSRSRPCSLACWHAIAWGRGIKGLVTGREMSGACPAHFYTWLKLVAGNASRVWVWQMGACEGLTYLDFWPRLTEGLWELSGYGGSSSANTSSSANSGEGRLCVIEDPPTIIASHPRESNCSVRWLDVRNLGAETWTDLYSDFGLSTVMPEHYDGWPATYRALACDRATVLKSWVVNWQSVCEDLRLGGPRQTAAAQAYNGWRNGYMKHGVLVHDDTQTLEMERLAIHSGRCEAFMLRRIGWPVYHLDSSANYAASAVAGPLPARFAFRESGSISDYQLRCREGWVGIGVCTVRTEVPLVPVRWEGNTIFPVGNFTTELCGPEIDLCIDRGALLHLGSVAYYAPEPLFQDYVATLYDARQEAEDKGWWARRSALKRLIVGLFGRFAQRNSRWVDCDKHYPVEPFCSWYSPNPRTGEFTRWRAIAGNHQYQEQAGESPESCPAIYAWVCSVARVQLLRWIEQAGWENVYYVDTDSIWTNKRGHDRLQRYGHVRAGVLGALALKRVYPWVRFVGYKCYQTDDGIVAAGIPKCAEYCEESGFRFWASERLKDSIRRRKEPEPVERLFTHRPGNGYAHGVVRSGGRVDPIRLEVGKRVN